MTRDGNSRSSLTTSAHVQDSSPKDERDDYGCDVDANKFFIIEFNNAKDEMDATDAAAICLTLNPAGQIGTTGIPYDYEIESVTSDLDLDIYEKVLAIINNK